MSNIVLSTLKIADDAYKGRITVYGDSRIIYHDDSVVLRSTREDAMQDSINLAQLYQDEKKIKLDIVKGV